MAKVAYLQVFFNNTNFVFKGVFTKPLFFK